MFLLPRNGGMLWACFSEDPWNKMSSPIVQPSVHWKRTALGPSQTLELRRSVVLGCFEHEILKVYGKSHYVAGPVLKAVNLCLQVYTWQCSPRFTKNHGYHPIFCRVGNGNWQCDCWCYWRRDVCKPKSSLTTPPSVPVRNVTDGRRSDQLRAAVFHLLFNLVDGLGWHVDRPFEAVFHSFSYALSCNDELWCARKESHTTFVGPATYDGCQRQADWSRHDHFQCSHQFMSLVPGPVVEQKGNSTDSNLKWLCLSQKKTEAPQRESNCSVLYFTHQIWHSGPKKTKGDISG